MRTVKLKRPVVGCRALHKTKELDSRQVAATKVEGDTEYVKLRIGNTITPWIHADNYDFFKIVD